MSSAKVSEIVGILEKDPILIEGYFRLSQELGTKCGNILQWKYQFHSGAITAYDLLTSLIQDWVSRQRQPTVQELVIVLKNCNLVAIAEELCSLYGSNTTIRQNCERTNIIPSKTNLDLQKTQFTFSVRSPITSFIGREKEIDKLCHQYHSITSTTRVHVIFGMGGQGKTELCKAFIQKLQTRMEKPPATTWFGGDNAQQLITSLAECCNGLGFPVNNQHYNEPQQLEPLINYMVDKIDTSNGWLVVIDNVDEEFPILVQFIKILQNHKAFILITSRRRDILAGEVEPFELDALSDNDAIQLVSDGLETVTPVEAKSLCHAIGNHALALQQAVAYIKAQRQISLEGSRYNITEYLQQLQTNATVLLKQPLKLGPYDATVLSIMEQTFETISTKHGEAIKLMQILCPVHPDGITFEFLFSLLRSVNEDDNQNQIECINQFDESLRLLKTFSLINVDGSIIYIHRLVQKVTKLHSETWKDYAIKLLQNLDISNLSKEELLHVKSIWEHASVDPNVVTRCSQRPYQIFMRMKQLSLVPELKNFANANHQLISRLLGPEDEATLNMEYCLARAYHVNGDYLDALVKLRVVLEKQIIRLGQENPSTLITAARIADVLCSLNKFQESLELNEEVLATQLIVLGDDDKETNNCRGVMALALSGLARKAEALALNQQVLKWRTRKFGSYHPSTLTVRHNIAVIFYDQRQFYEAKKEFALVLNSRVEVLGSEHASTLDTKSALASTLWAMNRKKEAIKVSREVLSSREKMLGPKHPDTIDNRDEVSKWSRTHNFDKCKIM